MKDNAGRIRVMRIITRMNVGGPAVQAGHLLRGLDQTRFDQRLYAGPVGPAEADYVSLRAPDIPVRPIAALGRALRPTDDIVALARLVREMRAFRPHIVHTHTAKAGMLGRLAALIAGVPVRIHTFHGHLLHGYFSPGRTRLLSAAERAVAKVSDRLVSVGADVRDDLLRAGIGQQDQYVVVPPGTSLAPPPRREDARRQLGLPLDPPVVAFVGRLTRIKRPDRFIEVARLVRRAVPHAVFVVCGSGAELPGEPGVVGLGWRSDVETVYAAADVVLLTSDNEGMPVTLIEAGMAGVPVVATQVGSVAEVVLDGVTGLLGRCRADELSAHTIRLLSDPALRADMGHKAREWTATEFGRDRLVSDIENLYLEVAGRNGWHR